MSQFFEDVSKYAKLWFAALLMAVSFAAGNLFSQQPRPNIVFILADDLGYGDVGCYNSKSKIATPHLDQLARDGVRFTNAYSAAAHCVPSRYSLLTGRYPFRGYPLRWMTHPTIPEGTVTLASLLHGAGYKTGCVGKWHCGFDGGVETQDRPLTGGPLDRGFDSFFGQHGSLDQPPYFFIRDRRATELASETIAESREEGLSVVYQGRYWRAGKIAPDFKHEEVLDRYADEAVAFLKKQDASKQPFFLYFPLTAPHGPWLPSKDFQGKSKCGPLGDFVMHVDDVVGRVLRTLAETGHGEDTLVIFSSDNGPLWFDGDVEKYGHDSSGGLRGRKGDIWEGGIRMPLIATWPGHIPANSKSDEVVGLVDMQATLAAVIGVPLPEEAGIDSVNILPAMLGEKRDHPLRTSIILQSLGPNDLAVRKGPWKFIPWLGSGGFLTEPRRVQPTEGGPQGQLYHLLDDPGETRNLYQDHPEIVKELQKILNETK